MTPLGVLERYGRYLPLSDRTPRLTLGEGSTPLVQAPSLASTIGCGELHLKLEGLNPTGSFKDRGMVVAVAKAVEEGSRAIVCASTGNTSASAAAYAAKAGLRCVVVVPRGNIALGKLAQARVYGARVLAIDGNFDSALDCVRHLSDRFDLTLVNSINPYRLHGQKTASFEIADALGDAPDYHVLPVGNAGNISAYWMGYKEYQAAGRTSRLPKMVGFQAAGAAPIVLGRPVPNPETIASAIRIGNPVSWKLATAARDESGGLIEAVTDEQIMDAYRLLAEREGVFAEPASAASIAGLLKLSGAGAIDNTGCYVAVITGHGLKDPGAALTQSAEVVEVSADQASLEKALDWTLFAGARA